MFDDIPPRFRAGVRALRVEPKAEPHPEIPGIYTLGECWSEEWPSAYGGEGDIQSDLHLYHGSFRALDERYGLDWEAELWETILHELLHHREAAAGTDELGALDWAEDQNQRRWEGMDWDPSFVLEIPEDDEGVRRLESEIFVEGEIVEFTAPEDDTAASGDRAAGSAATGGRSTVSFFWRGQRYALQTAALPGWTYVRVTNLAGGRLWVVVRVAESLWRRLLGLARGEARHDEAPARRLNDAKGETP